MHIEIFFKCIKPLLRFQKEFHGQFYDFLIRSYNDCLPMLHLLEWQDGQSIDPRRVGGNL